MKSLEELKALRGEMREKLSLKGDGGMRVVVGMATCGIAAGARPVLNTLCEETEKMCIRDRNITVWGKKLKAF